MIPRITIGELHKHNKWKQLRDTLARREALALTDVPFDIQIRWLMNELKQIFHLYFVNKSQE